MPNLEYYPYKYMLAMVNTLTPTGVTLKEIRSASGACTPDSVEIMKMLKYLTSHGTVLQENNSYQLKERPEFQFSRPRRIRLIHELNSLLIELSNSPQTVEELVNKMDWANSQSELQSYLDFLVQITARGLIQGNVSLLGRLMQRGLWTVP